jgi:hypothetical protein
MMRALWAQRSLLLNCAEQIPQMLRDAGFVDVQVATRSLPLGKWAGQAGINGRDNFIGVFRGNKTPVLKMGGLGFVTSESQFDELIDAVQDEWDATPASHMDFHVFTARKPVPVAQTFMVQMPDRPAELSHRMAVRPLHIPPAIEGFNTGFISACCCLVSVRTC